MKQAQDNLLTQYAEFYGLVRVERTQRRWYTLWLYKHRHDESDTALKERLLKNFNFK